MPTMKLSLVLVLLFACSTVSFQGVLADIICENLPTNVCAFSVSSFGKRCVLENSIKDGHKVEYQCKTTSEVLVGSNTGEYIETDKCVSACGVDRKSVGFSSDPLLEPTFIAKLCSPDCYHNCPNIVNLYFNLAAGEGAYLPDLCQRQQASLRRDMAQLQSDDDSSDVAPAPGPSPPRRDMIELESDDSVDDVPVAADDAPVVAAADDAPVAVAADNEILPANNVDIVAVEVVGAPGAADAPIVAVGVLTANAVDDPMAADVLTVDNVVDAPIAADTQTVGNVVDAPVADTPTQLGSARRELSRSNGTAPAPAPAVDDGASTIDTPAPSPSYF
ncbi:PREDICTED: uncharacterized protein LOC109174881 [Ipomoea nil]|uniref:uncharacterized protein LOC109174881 n=1 Tax=Ipomoea nil TaxID=35883 RepID=UPI000900C77F|nr:PREDICTED: uncharacterized protein LOC109174881 [Ipomoea nil]